MLRKDKILIIAFVIVVICLIVLTSRAKTAVSDYITNVKFYQSGDYAKLRFDVIQDFSISWEKVESDMIYFSPYPPAETDIYYYRAYTDTSRFGFGGFLETKDELNNIPMGYFVKNFLSGNTYDVFLTQWHCGYNGCADPDDFVVFQKEAGCSPDDSVQLKERGSGNTFTIYCAELKPSLSKTPVDTSHSNASKTNLAGLIALAIGLPTGFWVIYRIIKSVRFRRRKE